MKCWQSNKNNPANKNNHFNSRDMAEYGTMTDIVATISAVSAIHKRGKTEQVKKSRSKEAEVSE